MKSLFIAGLLAFAGMSNAALVTPEQFLTMSESFQLGIVASVVDATESTNIDDGGQPCIPLGATLGELHKISVAGVAARVNTVRGWPQSHPMYKYKQMVLTIPVNREISEALMKFYGCRKAKTEGYVLIR